FERNASAKETAELGQAFLDARKVWSRSQMGARSGVISVLGALDASGAISHADALQRAHEWMVEEEPRERAPGAIRLAAAALARTPEDVASFLPIEPHVRRTMPQHAELVALLGHLALVRGDADGAIASLTEATQSCAILTRPFTLVRAHLW